MVHQYKLNGYNIVIDTASGSVHSVDEVAYDIIENFKSMPEDEIIKFILTKYEGCEGVTEEDIKECLEDIRALETEGKLFSLDPYEKLATDYKNNSKVIKALCLHVAHTCNLNCSYCFASQGKYQGDRALMSLEVGKRAFDFLIENSGTRRNLEVDFFGGEPSLNFDVVRGLVEYARSIEGKHNKNFRFTYTTNGMLLTDEMIEFLNRHMHNVVLSLDGRREVNDKFRRDYAGKGSYDTIVPNFQKLVKSRDGKGYYVRGTFTHHNTDFTNDIFHMADLGFTELSMEPVVCSPDDPCALTEEDKATVFKQYELLASEMIKRRREGKPFTFYHYMLDLKNGPCIYKRITGCGSGTEYMAVTPWGELYPCHQFVGDEKFSLGNIYDGIIHPEVQEQFRSCNAYSREECRDCWARLYCSGGCAANSYHATGSVNGVYSYGCDLFKKRIECAVMMQVAKEIDEEAGAPSSDNYIIPDACDATSCQDCNGCE